MGVSPSIWRKKLMDSISSNLDYVYNEWYRENLPWDSEYVNTP